MQTLDNLRQRICENARKHDLSILAKAAELREAALRGQTCDNSRALKIALFLASAAMPSGLHTNLGA